MQRNPCDLTKGHSCNHLPSRLYSILCPTPFPRPPTVLLLKCIFFFLSFFFCHMQSFFFFLFLYGHYSGVVIVNIIILEQKLYNINKLTHISMRHSQRYVFNSFYGISLMPAPTLSDSSLFPYCFVFCVCFSHFYYPILLNIGYPIILFLLFLYVLESKLRVVNCFKNIIMPCSFFFPFHLC